MADVTKIDSEWQRMARDRNLRLLRANGNVKAGTDTIGKMNDHQYSQLSGGATVTESRRLRFP
jgi:hypothetical protein